MTKSSAVCTEFIMGLKFHFSKWKTYFPQFIDKFLQFEEIKYFIHYFEMRTV